MKSLLVAYGVTAITFLGLDAIWLSLAAKTLYRPKLGDLMLPQFHVAPAALFYLIYILGIVLLVIQPALAEGRVAAATMRGALLGLVAYATYDLTNQATLRGWPVAVTVADLCWGTFVTAAAATVGYWLAARV